MDAVGDQTTRRVSSPGENDRGALQSALLALADVTADEWQRLAARRVFFGYQSVGANLIEGIEDVLRSCPDLPLRIVESNDPSAMAEPGLYHARIGENGHPETKRRVFVDIVGRGVADLAEASWGIAAHDGTLSWPARTGTGATVDA